MPIKIGGSWLPPKQDQVNFPGRVFETLGIEIEKNNREMLWKRKLERKRALGKNQKKVREFDN